MLKHIARIALPGLRIPLLCVVFPVHMLLHLLKCLLPARLGGHPNKPRLLQADFYRMPAALFWAAWDGFFVPKPLPAKPVDMRSV